MTTDSFVLGPDIDLESEDVRDSDGTRLTEGAAEEIAADLIRRVGRPSLTAPGRLSPEVKARVPVELYDRLSAAARERHTTSSAIIREALERYLAS